MKPVIFAILTAFLIGCGKDENNSDDVSVTDIEGNVYSTVEIGTQIWLVENLKTTKFNDGTNIPSVPDAVEWNDLTTPAFSWYDNDPTQADPYGALYNWHAVATGKICMTGWHVPNSDE